MNIQRDANGKASLTGFSVESIIALLASEVAFAGEVPESEFERLVYHAVIDEVKNGNLAESSLLRSIRKKETHFLAQAIQRFAITTTLSIGKNQSLIPKFFDNRKINNSIITFRAAKNRYDLQPVIDLARELGIPEVPRDYKYVRIFTKGRTEQQAVDTALADLNILRGIWNLALNHWRIRRNYFATSVAVNQIQLGPSAFLHRAGARRPIKSVWTFSTTFQRTAGVRSLTSDVQRIYQYEGRIRNKLANSPFRSLIVQGLTDYALALDHENHEVAFLSLWKVLEFLSCTKPSESHIELVDRISGIFPSRAYHRAVLDILRRRRNQSAHPGSTEPVPDHFVNELRHRVEETIIFLVENKLRLRDAEELREFYILSRDQKELGREINLRKKSIGMLLQFEKRIKSQKNT